MLPKSRRLMVLVFAGLTLIMGVAVTLAQQDGERPRPPLQPRPAQTQSDLFGDFAPGPEAANQPPSDGPRASISLTVWAITVGDATEAPADEVSVDFAERVSNLPDRFESAEEVRELVGQLRVAGMLRKLREFRLTTLEGQPVQMQSGSNRPRIIATSISPHPRSRANRPLPEFAPQAPNAPRPPQTSETPEESESIVTNSITYEAVGTIVKLLPRIDSTGSVQVQFSYNSSDTEKAPEVTLSEVPGRKPLVADRVMTQEIASSVRLKSGGAVVVQSDSSQVLEGERPTTTTQLVILAATAEPALE